MHACERLPWRLHAPVPSLSSCRLLPMLQVEVYMSAVVEKMRSELRQILADAVGGAASGRPARSALPALHGGSSWRSVAAAYHACCAL